MKCLYFSRSFCGCENSEITENLFCVIFLAVGFLSEFLILIKAISFFNLIKFFKICKKIIVTDAEIENLSSETFNLLGM